MSPNMVNGAVRLSLCVLFLLFLLPWHCFNASGPRSTPVHWPSTCSERRRDERNVWPSWKALRLRWAQGENVSISMSLDTRGQRSLATAIKETKAASSQSSPELKDLSSTQRLRAPVVSRFPGMLCCQRLFKWSLICWSVYKKKKLISQSKGTFHIKETTK